MLSWDDYMGQCVQGSIVGCFAKEQHSTKKKSNFHIISLGTLPKEHIPPPQISFVHGTERYILSTHACLLTNGL